MDEQPTSALPVLTPEDQAFLSEQATSIRRLSDTASRNIIEIGVRLIAVKERLPHGQFGPWLTKEFQWSDRTARTFMKIAEKFGDKPEIASVLGPGVLAALASDSVPEEARVAIIKQAQAGEAVRPRDVRAAQKERSRPSVEPARKTQPLMVVSRKLDDNAPRAGVLPSDELSRVY